MDKLLNELEIKLGIYEEEGKTLSLKRGERIRDALGSLVTTLDKSDVPFDWKKAISLDAQLDGVQDAFYDHLGEESEIWIKEVFDEFVIGQDSGDLYKFPYMEKEDGEIVFAPPISVEVLYSPKSLAAHIKSIDENGMTIGGYGVIWGNPDILDLEGDFFTKSTDFWFDRITENPMVLYDHGQNEELKKSVVGKVENKRDDNYGLWVESQINRSNEYFDAIRTLVEDGRLGYSSGAIPHLVERKSNGELTSWAIAEFSLTTTPAEPRTLGVQQLRNLAKTEPAYKAFLLEEDEEDAKASSSSSEAERTRKLRLAQIRNKRLNILEDNNE